MTAESPLLPAINPTARHVAALDIGQDRCCLAIMPPGGEPFVTEHDRAAIPDIIRAAVPPGSLVVLELTGGLELPILAALEAEYQPLIAQNTDSAALRRLLKRPRKTDKLDADLIARLAALSLDPATATIIGHHLRPWPQMRAAVLTRPKVRYLERLVSDRRRLTLRAQRRPDPLHQQQLTDLIAHYDRLIAEAVADLTADPGPAEHLLMTLPGISPRRAAIIAATIGDVSRFATGDALIKYVGLRPPLPPISGGKPIGRPKIARSSTILAGELHMWALTVARWPAKFGPMGAAYERYKAQERKGPGLWTAKRILIRTAWRMLTDGVPYDPDHRTARQRRRQAADAAPALDPGPADA